MPRPLTARLHSITRIPLSITLLSLAPPKLLRPGEKRVDIARWQRARDARTLTYQNDCRVPAAQRCNKAEPSGHLEEVGRMIQAGRSWIVADM